ncbi:DUF1841 family protein [uncultured Thiohalocapsa sp.]|uniref:DUF1841 family protein n=1 Tax=uncultured Thiohalocapsa sp. TaxID=768990 RepID=UPI0025F225B9|nr:DUF1841 family protein [uncultured Thiohalocapsa sp.]
MFGAQRDPYRRRFIAAWQKAQSGQPLDPLEQRIAEVVEKHPEYHGLLADADKVLDRDWRPEGGEANPFLHMALHLALLEQIGADHPRGIAALYQGALRVHGDDVHTLEHRLLDCLAESMWRMQRDGREDDPNNYLACIRRTLGLPPASTDTRRL